MEGKDYTKAVMFLGLCLEVVDSSTEKSVSYESKHLLSEAHFQLDAYSKCLLAGNQCFKLKSNKSEVSVAFMFSFRDGVGWGGLGVGGWGIGLG